MMSELIFFIFLCGLAGFWFWLNCEPYDEATRYDDKGYDTWDAYY